MLTRPAIVASIAAGSLVKLLLGELEFALDFDFGRLDVQIEVALEFSHGCIPSCFASRLPRVRFLHSGFQYVSIAEMATGNFVSAVQGANAAGARAVVYGVSAI